MKELIKMLSILTLLILLLFLFPVIGTEARQGCCSHHGGVCGCRCCDGTSLSAKCAPYYPQCNKPAPIYVPPKSEPKPEPENNKPSESNSPISNKYTVEVPKESNNYGWLIGTGIVVGSFITYLFLKRKNK